MSDEQPATAPSFRDSGDAGLVVDRPLLVDAVVVDTAGPEDDPALLVEVRERVVLESAGVAPDGAVLRLMLRGGAVELTDHDQVLELQAVINRAVNTWRLARAGQSPAARRRP